MTSLTAKDQAAMGRVIKFWLVISIGTHIGNKPRGNANIDKFIIYHLQRQKTEKKNREAMLTLVNYGSPSLTPKKQEAMQILMSLLLVISNGKKVGGNLDIDKFKACHL